MTSGAYLSAAGLADFTQSLREVLAQAAGGLRQQSDARSEGAMATVIGRLGIASEALAQNLLGNTVPRTEGAGSAAGTIGKWALGMATGGVAPLIAGLLGLFGGDRQEPAPLLVSYARPQSAALEGTASDERVSWNWRDGVQPAGVPAQNVTVQVQAMDSRSFLDHKDDIARAVREAVLNSHSLNDALAEL